MGGLMSAMGGGSYQGGDASTEGGTQRSGLHITTGGSDTGSDGSNRVVMLAGIAAAGFVLYSLIRK